MKKIYMKKIYMKKDIEVSNLHIPRAFTGEKF